MKEPTKPRKNIRHHYDEGDLNNFSGELSIFSEHFKELAEKYPKAKIEIDAFDAEAHYEVFEIRDETEEEFKARKEKYLNDLLEKEIQDARRIEEARLKKEKIKIEKEEQEKELYRKLHKKYSKDL